MWDITFYTSESGRVPVRDFIQKKLNEDQQVKLRERLLLLRDHGPQMAEEYPKALKRLRGEKYRDIYEIRIAKGQLRVFLFFVFDGETAVLVHAITKAGLAEKKIKAQYKIALTRKNEWRQRRDDS